MNGSVSSPPTIKDVARAAKVSVSTASYVINNGAGARRISEPTKQRVWAAAGRLGYKRNPLGQALQRGYTNQVTLIIVTWNLGNLPRRDGHGDQPRGSKA